MTPCKRPGPRVCQANVSDEEGDVEGRTQCSADLLQQFTEIFAVPGILPGAALN